MVRGVNRQIIEVNQTGSRYFERALLFVKPEYSELSRDKLENEADRFLLRVGQPPPQSPFRLSSQETDKTSAKQAKKRRGAHLSRAARIVRMKRRRKIIFFAGLSIIAVAAFLLLSTLL